MYQQGVMELKGAGKCIRDPAGLRRLCSARVKCLLVSSSIQTILLVP